MRTLVCFLGAAAAMLGAAGAVPKADAAPSEQVIFSSSRFTGVSAYGDAVAFSEYVPGIGYRLQVWRHGRTRTLRIPARDVPFDVDLGPGPRGRLTAVYSRCRHEQRHQFLGRGCDLYMVGLRGHERRLARLSRRGYSEHHPSIWRSRIAFARYRNDNLASETGVDRLYIADRRRIRRVPAGPTRGGGGDYFADSDAQAGRLDLRGTQLAFSWEFQSGSCDTPTPDGWSDEKDTLYPYRSQIRLVTPTGRSRKIDSGCIFDPQDVYDPSLSSRGLTYLRARNSDFAVRTVDSHGRLRSTRPAAADLTTLSVADDLSAEVRGHLTGADDAGEWQVVVSSGS